MSDAVATQEIAEEQEAVIDLSIAEKVIQKYKDIPGKLDACSCIKYWFLNIPFAFADILLNHVCHLRPQCLIFSNLHGSLAWLQSFHG